MKNYVQSNPQSSIIFNKSEINFLLGSICSSNHSQEKAHVFLSLFRYVNRFIPLMKSIKLPKEIELIKEAYLRDSVALSTVLARYSFL